MAADEPMDDAPTDDPEIEAAAELAAQQARQEYRRQQRLVEYADRVAAALGAGPAGNRVAMALADAYLATPEWSHAALVDATRLVLGDAPQWTDDVVDEVLTYSRPPADRPRELARFIARLRAFRSPWRGHRARRRRRPPYGSCTASSRRP